MIRNWKYFAGAALIGGAALLKAGAPPLAVALGIAFGAFLTRRSIRSA
jgi:hypothetical protein